MKKTVILGLITLIFHSCEIKNEISSINPINWENRTLKNALTDSLEFGRTYLSVYSEIYSATEHRTQNLTETISMRNTNVSDSLYILKALYYNTEGKLLRSYFEDPIFLVPMETVEIVIDEMDMAGGTGANFIFDWKKNPKKPDPLFEGVMISTSGQQGLSFTTQGKRIE